MLLFRSLYLGMSITITPCKVVTHDTTSFLLDYLPSEDDDEDEVKESTCCGIRWKHLVLLFLFIGPTFLTVLFTGSDMVMKFTGLQMPDWLRAEPPNPYRTRLMAFYRKNNPSKVGKSRPPATPDDH